MLSIPPAVVSLVASKSSALTFPQTAPAQHPSMFLSERYNQLERECLFSGTHFTSNLSFLKSNSQSPHFINDFKVLRIIGRGGFGCVFECESKKTLKHFAVKAVPFDSSCTDQSPILEAQVLSQFDSPHIVRLEAFWTEPMSFSIEKLMEQDDTDESIDCSDCVLFLQMELCLETFERFIEKSPKMTRKRVIDMILQLLHAVETVHSHGYIHRDIKPSNILLQHQKVKLCDFGHSAPLSQTQTDTAYVQSLDIGTLTYASPEQLRGKLQNSRTDVFALGMVMLEMVSRFKTGMERSKVLQKARKGYFPPLNFLNQDILGFIRLMLSNDPERRPAVSELIRGFSMLKAPMGLSGNSFG